MPYRHEFTPQEGSHNLFEGQFTQDSWQAAGERHSKVVEQAKTKESGTATRARGKRGGNTGISNKETFNFQLPPTDNASPRRDYTFKPEGRNVLRVGEMQTEAVKSGRKPARPVVPKDPPLTHKRVMGTTNTSGGAQGALLHDAMTPTTPSSPKGKRTEAQGLPSPRGNIGRGWNPRQDSVSYSHVQKKRTTGGAVPRPSPIRPWEHGTTDASPKRNGKKTNTGGYSQHTFAEKPKQAAFPGYKIQAPFDTHE